MSRYIWAVLCYKAVTDKDSNQVSLLDVIESLQVETIEGSDETTAVAIPVQLAILWTRSNPDESETAQARVRFLSPGGDPIKVSELAIDLERTRNFRAVVKMQGILVHGSGQYWFLVEKQNADGSWMEESRVPVYVSVSRGPIGR